MGAIHFYSWALRRYDGNTLGAPQNVHEEQELLHHGRLYGLAPVTGESLVAFSVRLNERLDQLGRKYRGRVSLPGDV